MKYSLISVSFVTVLSLAMTGCNTSESGAEASDDGGSITTLPGLQMQKVYLDSATLEEIAPHKKECKGANKDHKICVEICHRPPGNPANGKSKVLPLSAVRAHLCHGSDKIADNDYLGPCHGDDDNGVDDGGDTGGGDTGGGDTEGEIPAWCAPYIDIDSDCDGIIDGTGDPLL